ncbi:MAG TPA: hypothetical protein EYQ21_02005 [Flavobacteriales bacterium]|nr:hypothetical protein [Flavobacteriales bacterium]
MAKENTLKLFNSATTDAEPTTSNLDYGELAINYADKKLFFRDSGNNIKQIRDDEAVSADITALAIALG